MKYKVRNLPIEVFSAEEAKRSGVQIYKCPTCLKRVKPKIKKCSHCGHSIDWPGKEKK